MATNYSDPTYQKNIEQLGSSHPEWNQYQSWKNTQPGSAPAAPAPSGPTGPTLPQTAGQAVTGAVPAGNQVQQGQQTNVAGAFQQALVNRLAPGPLNAQSPEVAPALQANRLAEQRGAERQRAQLAQSAAYNGTQGVGGDARLLGIEQDRAQREGQFAGNMMHQAGRQRQQDITAALALGGQMLTDQDKMKLQKELADLDAQLRREGLSMQGSLGSQDIGLRRELGHGNLNLGLLSAMLQNQQFGQNLGFQADSFGAQLDQNAILGLLNGLG